jgi:hypothetical protein
MRRDEHHPPRAAVARGFEHIGGPVAIAHHELRRIAGGDLSRDVIDHVRARGALAQRGLVRQIAAHQPDLGSPPVLRSEGGPAHQRRDAVPAGEQRRDQVRTDKAGGPGDEDVHSALS